VIVYFGQIFENDKNSPIYYGLLFPWWRLN
jgi:hypothetical protein